MTQIKLLLAVQFGAKSDQTYILVQKIERVLHDLDFVYVNLIKILREPDAARHQTDAQQQLNERFDFIAQSISAGPPKVKAKRPLDNPNPTKHKTDEIED